MHLLRSLYRTSALAVLACTPVAHATVTLTVTAGSFGDSLLDEFGDLLDGDLDAFLLIDTEGGDFSDFVLTAGTVSWLEGLPDAPNYFVADFGQTSSIVPDIVTVAQFTSLVYLDGYGGLSEGDTFAVLWFTTPDDATFDFDVVAGASYGLTRQSTWVLPGDGGTFTSGTEGPAPGGLAVFTASAVPEPSSAVLLLGAAAWGAALLRRRRNHA